MQTTWLSALALAGALASAAALMAWSSQSAHDSPCATSPLAELDRPGAGGERGQHLRGRITEKLGAGSYTYLDLALPDGSRRWVVVMAGAIPDAGEEVTVVAMGVRSDFYSRRLDRRFDHITFASLDRDASTQTVQ